jgi:hypothetical protein
VEIAENSENHLKAIIVGRQVGGRDGFSRSDEIVAEKPQGEEKAAAIGLVAGSPRRRVLNP